jgi:hypothetical protein
MGYSLVRVDDLEPAGPAAPFAAIAVGARRGSYEPRGPF